MEKSIKLYRLSFRSFLVFILVVALALSLGLSVYADTSSNTIEIDGVFYDQIDITADQLAALVNGGSVYSEWFFQTTSYSGYTFGDLFNLQNHTKGQFHVSQNFPYELPKNKIFALLNGNDVFIGLPYVYHANRISEDDLTVSFGISIPFDAYFYNTTISYSFSNVYTQTSSRFIAVYDGNVILNSLSTLNTVSPTPYWNTIPLFVDFYNKYNWSFDGYTLTNLRTAYFNNTLTTSNTPQKFSTFYIGSVVNSPMHAGSYSPVGFIIHGPISVLVDHDEATVIEEYLGLITGRPNAAQRQRIQVLEDEFQSKRDQMDSIVDELHVPMPDLEDSNLDVGSLPQDALDGISAVIPYVSNVFNFSFIVILVSSTLIFTAIKLLLYGSGHS